MCPAWLVFRNCRQWKWIEALELALLADRCCLLPDTGPVPRYNTPVLGYLRTLSAGRIVLWCYAIWYVVNVAYHFDSRPRLWITSIGISAIIGTALLISTRVSSRGTTQLDRWQIFRLYLMPFCVSSFAALVKDEGYFLVFPPNSRENIVGAAAMAAFVLIVVLLKKATSRSSAPVAEPSLR